MRFEFQSFGEAFVAPTRGVHGGEEWKEWTEVDRDPPLPTKPARRGWWRSVAASLSVVTAHAVEGFASSAVALYPELRGSRNDYVNDREPAEDPPVLHAAGGRLAVYGTAMRSPMAQSLEEQLVMNGLIDFGDAGQLEIARPGSRGLRSSIMSVWSRMRVAHENRRASAELAALDDRMLKDIGISRHEIDGVVRRGRNRS